MLTALAIFLILLLLLLLVPVTVIYQLNVQQVFEGKIRLQWFAGMIKLNLPKFSSGSKVTKQKWEKKHKSRVSKKYKRFRFTSERKLFWQRVIKFLRDLWRAIKKREMHLNMRIGLGDPADTGRLWGLLGPLSQIFADMKDATIEIEPAFDEAIFQLQGRGVMQFVPLQLVYLVIGLILSPSFWKEFSPIGGARQGS